MKMQKMKNAGLSGGGPSSSIGIMRFFDTDMGGPKLTTEFVMGIVIAFVFLLLVLHFVS